MQLVTRMAPGVVLRELDERRTEWTARGKDLRDALGRPPQDAALLRAKLVNMLSAWREFLELAVNVADGYANACGFALTALESELSKIEKRQAFNEGAHRFIDGVQIDTRQLQFHQNLALKNWAKLAYSTTKIASKCFVDSGCATDEQRRRLQRTERATDLAIFGAYAGIALVTGAWRTLGPDLVSQAVSLCIRFQSSVIDHRATVLAGQRARVAQSLYEQMALMQAQAWTAQRARLTYHEIGRWLQAAAWE